MRAPVVDAFFMVGSRGGPIYLQSKKSQKLTGKLSNPYSAVMTSSRDELALEVDVAEKDTVDTRKQSSEASGTDDELLVESDSKGHPSNAMHLKILTNIFRGLTPFAALGCFVYLIYLLADPGLFTLLVLHHMCQLRLSGHV